MDAKFHRRVQADLDDILDGYYAVSDELGDDFYAELEGALNKAISNPTYHNFDRSGLRRCSLHRFPYHFLYDVRDSKIRVWVLRHDRRKPSFGLRRFKR